MGINLRQISKSFANTSILHDISLHIPAGEMLALLGPSGSGKTTLLRIIAGLEFQDAGKLYFHGNDVSQLAAQQRKTGFVFQHYALFRHMTVFDNVAFGLHVLPRRQRPAAALIQQKVEQLLEKVQLSSLAQRYPAHLSGGQKQRVALARALAVEPSILLLDEPFGALDARVRKELRHWLRQLHRELAFTCIFVTHDQQEALEIADRVVVMRQGVIEQAASPDQLWHQPASRFVLEFLGEVNCIKGQLAGAKCQVADWHWLLDYIPQQQGEVDLLIRPWDVELQRHFSHSTPLPVQVLDSSPHHQGQQLIVQPVGWQQKPLTVTVIKPSLRPGEPAFIGLQRAHLYQGTQRIHDRNSNPGNDLNHRMPPQEIMPDRAASRQSPACTPY